MEYKAIDHTDITRHPIRYYDLIANCSMSCQEMSEEELRGFVKCFSGIAEYFWHMHFNEQIEHNQKTLVKTLDEIKEIAMETLLNRFPKTQ